MWITAYWRFRRLAGRCPERNRGSVGAAAGGPAGRRPPNSSPGNGKKPK